MRSRSRKLICESAAGIVGLSLLCFVCVSEGAGVVRYWTCTPDGSLSIEDIESQSCAFVEKNGTPDHACVHSRRRLCLPRDIPLFCPFPVLSSGLHQCKPMLYALSYGLRYPCPKLKFAIRSQLAMPVLHFFSSKWCVIPSNSVPCDSAKNAKLRTEVSRLEGNHILHVYISRFGIAARYKERKCVWI